MGPVPGRLPDVSQDEEWPRAAQSDQSDDESRAVGAAEGDPVGITNPRTQKPYTTVAGSFGRTVERAGITTGDVTLHTLRHTAISRMIEAGCDDFTVMASRGTPRRVCSRGTRIPRKIARLRPWSCFEWSQIGHNGPVETMHASPRQPTKRL